MAEGTSDLAPTFVEVPFQTLVHRIDNGSKGLVHLASLLTERKDLQEKDILYALKVGRANVFDHEIAASTSERLLGFYKNYYLYLYKATVQHHKDLADDVLNGLEGVRSKRGSRVMHVKQSIQHDIKAISIAKEALEKAKKVLIKAKVDHKRAISKLAGLERAVAEAQRAAEEKQQREGARDNGNKWRMFSAFESNPEQDRDKQIKKVDKRLNEVTAARQNIVERKKDLLQAYATLDENYHRTSLEFQQLEVDRMRAIQSSLKAFCQLERAALTHQLDLLRSLEDAVALQQPEEDVALFIAQTKHVEFTHRYSHALCFLDERLQSCPEEEEGGFMEEPMEDEPRSAQDLSALLQDREAPPDPVERADRTTARPDSPSSSPAKFVDSTQANADMLTLALNVDQLQDLVERLFGPSDCDRAVDAPGPPPTPSAEGASAPAEEDWEAGLATKESRDRFLMELDRRRGKSASLPHGAYESLSFAMKVFLDQCHESGDVMSAMRIANMANTFHEKAPLSPIAALTTMANGSADDSHDSPDGDSDGRLRSPRSDCSSGGGGDGGKTYLQSDPKLRDHRIWRQPGFWTCALRESVLAELQRSPAVHWHEMSSEELRESVIAVHNIVFGQLGSLSFAMQQQGIPNEEIVRQVRELSRGAQLPEDQEFQLVSSITGVRIKEYTPPPAMAMSADLHALDAQVTGLVVNVQAGELGQAKAKESPRSNHSPLRPALRIAKSISPNRKKAPSPTSHSSSTSVTIDSGQQQQQQQMQALLGTSVRGGASVRGSPGEVGDLCAVNTVSKSSTSTAHAVARVVADPVPSSTGERRPLMKSLSNKFFRTKSTSVKESATVQEVDQSVGGLREKQLDSNDDNDDDFASL